MTVNRKRKLDQFTSHNTLQLYDFISRKKAKIRAANQGKQSKKVKPVNRKFGIVSSTSEMRL